MTPADIGALLARYGVHALRVRLVARLDCEVYRITPQPRSGGDLALRLYPATRSDSADVESELEWLRALANAGLNAPAPSIATASGSDVAWPLRCRITPRHPAE